MVNTENGVLHHLPSGYEKGRGPADPHWSRGFPDTQYLRGTPPRTRDKVPGPGPASVRTLGAPAPARRAGARARGRPGRGAGQHWMSQLGSAWVCPGRLGQRLGAGRAPGPAIGWRLLPPGGGGETGLRGSGEARLRAEPPGRQGQGLRLGTAQRRAGQGRERIQGQSQVAQRGEGAAQGGGEEGIASLESCEMSQAGIKGGCWVR